MASIWFLSSSSPSWPSTWGKASLRRAAAAFRTLVMRYVRSSGLCSSILRWTWETTDSESMLEVWSSLRLRLRLDKWASPPVCREVFPELNRIELNWSRYKALLGWSHVRKTATNSRNTVPCFGGAALFGGLECGEVTQRELQLTFLDGYLGRYEWSKGNITSASGNH